MNIGKLFALSLAVGLGIALAGCAEKTDTGKADKATAEAAAKAGAEAAAKAAAAKALEDEARALGIEAVAYGLPLVISDVTLRKATNVAVPGGFSAPVNQIVNLRAFPTAEFKDVVRANVDTLYSNAFMDLSKEPMVLSVPDTRGRYYLMPMMDGWTNVFASPGKRTTGTKAGHYAIVGPGWTGTLPKGVEVLRSPTDMVWMIGRTQTNGPKDYAAVHAIQNQFRLVPLSAFGKPYTPPPGTVDPGVDMKTPPVEQVAKMGAATYFGRLAALMKANPPPAADAPMLARLAKIGIVPGQPFDMAKLDPAVAKGLENVVEAAFTKLNAAAKSAGELQNGWRIPSPLLGNYGTDYGTRAVVALFGLGANLPADAMYPSAFTDGDGKPLDGANRYVLHFDKGQLPPANAFWSATMYNAQSFFVDNPINRYAISSWMPLKRNKDGSLDLYIQRASPGKDKESNWLPAAEGEFSVTMRIYWPKPDALEGKWKPPAIAKLQ
jgi:hypothetical protein